MGVKGLNQLLKRMCGQSHISLVPICNYSGKKIAIDASLYICIFKTRQNYVYSIVEFLTLLRENNIHPFFVFDGVAPVEKRHERIERAEKKNAARNRISSLERDLYAYKTTGELSYNLQHLDVKVRKLVPTKISADRIQEYIDKLKSQILTLKPQDFDTMKEILDAFGIPYTNAEGEGEFLCSSLARHGIVETVMTCDTDVLPCLTPSMITKIEGNYFHVTTLSDILENLQLTTDEFIDLCIMCGTDFNTNIPKIGPVRAYELIHAYKSIDSIPKDVDISPLSHIRVREIFHDSDNRPTIVVPFCDKPNYDMISKWVTNVDEIKKKLKPRLKKID
jgi:5'-3' exonuclease